MYLSCALYAFIEFALLICVYIYLYIYIYIYIYISVIYIRKISMSFRKLIIMLNLWLNMGLGICFAEEF
jgi:hypothetical protein